MQQGSFVMDYSQSSNAAAGYFAMPHPPPVHQQQQQQQQPHPQLQHQPTLYHQFSSQLSNCPPPPTTEYFYTPQAGFLLFLLFNFLVFKLFTKKKRIFGCTTFFGLFKNENKKYFICTFTKIF